MIMNMSCWRLDKYARSTNDGAANRECEESWQVTLRSQMITSSQ